jgi:hypothetical protein
VTGASGGEIPEGKSVEWYEIVDDDSLEQGDILLSVRTPRALVSKDGQLEVLDGSGGYIILSQTCDLENDKVREVLLASIISYQQLAHEIGGIARSSKFREAVIQGTDISYFLLHEFTATPKLEWSLANFHQLRLADISSCRRQVVELGPRLRMVPPYKEHLAQSFGRYMMRVALPQTAHAFKSVEYVKPD